MSRLRLVDRRLLLFIAGVLASVVAVFMMVSPAYAGDGTDGSSGDGSGDFSDVTSYWKTGDWATYDDASKALSSQHNKYMDEHPNAYDKALKRCQDIAKSQGATCSNPRIVAIGANFYQGWWTSAPPYGIVADPNVAIGCRDISVQNNTINTCSPVTGSAGILTEANLARGTGTKTSVGLVVIGKFQYQSKGWYPVYTPHKRVDVASANKISSHQFAPCAAYYYMTATGIDGYVKGRTTRTTKYQTPYGKLYDAVQTGGTWTSASGKTYGPFKGDWANDDAKLSELEEARNVSCDETQKMTIKYNFGGDVAGSSDKKYTGGESTDESSSDGVVITLKGSDFDSKDDFLKAYAKGGIYKIVKAKKEATLTGKTTDVKYFYRKSNWFEFVGWKECKKGQVITAKDMGLEGWSVDPDVTDHWSSNNDNKCDYIGQSKPGFAPKHASAIDMRDDYNNSNTHATADGRDHGFYGGEPYTNGYYSTTANWIEANAQESADIKALKNHMNLGGETRELTAVFNRGYVTKFKCGGVEVSANDVGQNKDMLSQKNCEAVDWAFQNDILGTWTAESQNGHNTGALKLMWRPGGKEAFQNGMPLHGAAESTLNSQLHPVSNRFQSIVTVAYQDFVNMNCDQTDFNDFVNKVRSQQSALGLGGDKILQVDVNTKFSQTAHTGVISRDDADRLGWKSLAEITPRVMASTRINGTTWVEGLKAVDVMGSGKVDGQSAAAYVNVTSGKYYHGYDASKDPIYSKECPFDCTPDKTQSSAAALRSNVTDKDKNPTPSDVSSGATGVKVRATNPKGVIVDDSEATNTANMVFFRNNEWNQFTVDVYAPVNGGTAAGQVSYNTEYNSNLAKSTTVTRDPNGTTWFAKKEDGSGVDTSKQLTEMQAKQSGTYKDIFTGNDLGEKDYADQTQTTTSNGTTDGVSVVMSGSVNDFQIKSAWATESGLPLKFQVKWEYDADNHVSIPDTVSITGEGTPNGNTTGGVNWKTVATKVDGKCLSQQNTKTPSPDTTELNHDSSGSGRDDVDDRTFRKDGESGVAKRGYFQVTFVRATAE